MKWLINKDVPFITYIIHDKNKVSDLEEAVQVITSMQKEEV